MAGVGADRNCGRGWIVQVAGDARGVCGRNFIPGAAGMAGHFGVQRCGNLLPDQEASSCGADSAVCGFTACAGFAAELRPALCGGVRRGGTAAGEAYGLKRVGTLLRIPVIAISVLECMAGIHAGGKAAVIGNLGTHAIRIRYFPWPMLWVRRWADGGAAEAHASRFDHDNHEYLGGRGDG